ncbi:isochorismatase family cysteine hydrolase [Oceanobacillus sp. FSL H7-0719]|uniref:isochorismatase family cysteine hydrolase n=1 Tax=Oceanobacillus sp. FSL H7-0719 TaxID=2954507 RepID=UPI003247C7B7
MQHNLDNTAVVFIDLINDFNFPGGDKLLKNTKKILPNIIKLKEYATANNLPVIYVNDHYGLWQADFNKIISKCTNKNSKEIIDQIKPADNDYFLIKPQHSAFFQTPLHSLLTELNRYELILAGIAGDICILFTAKDAYMYQMDLHIPRNCMASEEEDNNDYALYLMQSVMKANIAPVD